MTGPTPERLLPIASPRSARAAVVAMLARHRRITALAVTTLVGAATASLVTAPLLGGVVDLVAAGDLDGITVRVLLLAAAAVVQAGLAFVGLSSVARLGELVLAALREGFVEHALGLRLDRIEQGGSGDLVSRVTEDVAMISDAVRTSVPEVVQSALVIGLTVVGLTALDWRFGLAALLAVPIQAGTTRWYLRRSAPLYAQRRAAAGGEQQQLLETIGGAATVRAFGLADEHLRLVRERVDRSVGLTVTGTRLVTQFFGRLNVAELVGLSAVLVTGFLLVRGGVVTVGAASAAALYFANLFGPVNSVLFLLDTMQSATASLARIVGVLHLPSDATRARPPGAEPRAPADGAIKADGLSFAYVPGHDVLHDVDLDVPAGGTVALVGGSGGGKTTLAALIAGIRTPGGGSVHVGGVRVDELDPDRLRVAIVLVTQEIHVFAGPLAEDLRLARPAAAETDLYAALEAVGAAEWVRLLPDGLDTVVGEGGHGVGPERAQQIALARVLLADPLVAILDEATAETGSSGARALDRAAHRVLAGRTGILVAHRLSQAATADLVVVLEAGRIIERGRHEELLARGGRYARLWATWSAGPDPQF